MYLHSFLLLILFVSAEHILCIINGEFVEWNRHANLVKIFARERNSEIITSCSGSLISSSLILTAPKCLLNQTTNERLDEIIISYPTFRRPKTVPADIVDITDSWALLKITPLKHEMLCPPKPAPARVAQLNLRISLLKSSVVPLDDLNDKHCYMIGFKTSNKAADFVGQDEVQFIDLMPLTSRGFSDAENSYFTIIKNNKTACWDDTGAALMCTIPNLGEVQVGVFHSLAVPSMKDDGRETPKPTTTQKAKDSSEIQDSDENFATKRNGATVSACSDAIEMRFNVIVNDERLIKNIEKHDLPAFVDLYERCRYIYRD